MSEPDSRNPHGLQVGQEIVVVRWYRKPQCHTIARVGRKYAMLDGTNLRVVMAEMTVEDSASSHQGLAYASVKDYEDDKARRLAWQQLADMVSRNGPMASLETVEQVIKMLKGEP